MIVIRKVSDFAKWKISYDEHDSLRLVNGIHSYVIVRGAAGFQYGVGSRESR